ncbi:MAG: hypothetical protein ACP5RE_01110 [Candidatus Acidifodinimicrobium sp.]
MQPKKMISSLMKEQVTRDYLLKLFSKFGISDIKLDKTPLGVRVVIRTPKPRAIVNRASNELRIASKKLGEIFEQSSPRIEVEESEDPMLDPNVVADAIAFRIARFGPMKYKVIAHKMLDAIMAAGARGAEIEIGGVIKERAAHFKFRPNGGILPKSGQVEDYGVRKGQKQLLLKRGAIGIKVTIVTKSSKLGGINITDGRENRGPGDGASKDEHKEDTGSAAS